MSGDQEILNEYRKMVLSAYPNYVSVWPLISGYDIRIGVWHQWHVLVFTHTGNSLMTARQSLPDIENLLYGLNNIDESNREEIRRLIESHHRLRPVDAVILLPPNRVLPAEEFRQLLSKHEMAMGLIPAKIFLSHKGADKEMVRDFKRTLDLLGFETWLDEDAMPAGTERERGILSGFEDSCAAVFFITSRFKDENYLATEIDYAISQKRIKKSRFAIITLLFLEEHINIDVPKLLERYIWKQPTSRLEALREILSALPVAVSRIEWKLSRPKA